MYTNMRLRTITQQVLLEYWHFWCHVSNFESKHVSKLRMIMSILSCILRYMMDLLSIT